jgi:hypothetical protein
MAMIEIDRDPSRRDLRIFALLLPVFFGLVGAERWHHGSPRLAVALWIVGCVAGVVAFASISAARRLYVGWMIAVSPIAWVVSHVALLAVYLLVATPTALVLRLLRRDPLARRFDENATSYWIRREPERDRTRYFRQF